MATGACGEQAHLGILDAVLGFAVLTVRLFSGVFFFHDIWTKKYQENS